MSTPIQRIIDYGPYAHGSAPGSPVSTAQMDQDLSIISSIADTVRVYTVDDNVDYVVSHAAAFGLKVIPSISLANPNADMSTLPTLTFDQILAQDPTIKAELDNLIDLLNHADLSNIPFVDIGSEEISHVDGWSDTSLPAAIDYVRSRSPAGIKFTTAETFDTQYYNSDNPDDHHTRLGDGVDVIYANIHPYWEGVPLSQAVDQVIKEYEELVATYPGKQVIISETGWPSDGAAFGEAVPSLANEQAFWQAFIVEAQKDGIPYGAFEAFDEPWKGTQQEAEGHWGLLDDSRNLKVDAIVPINGLDYIASYADLINAFGVDVHDALNHYVHYGHSEGRTVTFNGLDYIASYSDLIKALGANEQAGATHFIEDGFKEGRHTTFNGLDYIASYGDLIKALGANEQAGATHYIEDGYYEGRTTTFNGLDYIASYGDLVKALGANEQAGATHFIEDGYYEGRTTTFNGLDYIASYGDLIKALGANEQAGVTHFIDDGYSEGRTTTFNGLDYIASYGDLVKALGANEQAGATHFIKDGYSEGRTTTFDGLDYIASYGDLIKNIGANEQAGATHFIKDGYIEGRTTTFDGLAYIANYTDLMTALGANNDAGATHYIDFGNSEGRTTTFNVAAYENAHPDLIGKYATNDQFLTAYIQTYDNTHHLLT